MTYSPGFSTMSEHGTITMYCNNGCRCDLCREAQRVYMRQYRSTGTGRGKARRNSQIKSRVAWACIQWMKQNQSGVYYQILDEQTARADA